MGAGQRNRLITIQKKTTTYNSFHEPINAWSTLLTVWAQKITTGGTDFYAAQKLNASTTAVYKVPYTNRILSTHRILDCGRTYEILGPPNDVDGRRRELQIFTKEVV